VQNTTDSRLLCVDGLWYGENMDGLLLKGVHNETKAKIRSGSGVHVFFLLLFLLLFDFAIKLNRVLDPGPCVCFSGYFVYCQ
jgi:hypothetical protein